MSLIMALLFVLFMASQSWGDTCGVTTDSSSSFSSSSDRKSVSSCVAGSTGTVSSLTCRLWLSAAGTSNWRGVIYSNVAAAPSARLAVTDDGSFTNTTEAANTLNFSGVNLISLTSGTTYWVGAHVEDPGTPNWLNSTDSTASGRGTNVDTWSNGSDDPFGSVTSATGIMDCYVTFGTATVTPQGSLMGILP